MTTYIVFSLVALAAAVINTIAGGGGLLTFPVLALVLPPVIADATSGFALLPAYFTATWGSRKELTQVPRWLWWLVVPSLLGGLLGALLLSWSGNRGFIVLVPWLVLLGTLLLLARPFLTRRGDAGSSPSHASPVLLLTAMSAIFVVAIYGGYFGAGIGILMIAALGLIGLADMRQAVALKNALTGGLRTLAIGWLIVESKVDWEYGLPMAGGAIVGGYIGGKVSSRAPRGVIRGMVLAIGFGVAGYYFWRLYGLSVMQVAGE
jgi:uncharacterized membrane protein YfcA